MAKHHPDQIMCRKQPGVAVGRLCLSCDGKCCLCDSFVKPHTQVRVCDTCDYGAMQGRCIICGNKGYSDAYYCKECCLLEKDRDGTCLSFKLSINTLLLASCPAFLTSPYSLSLLRSFSSF